MSWPTFITKQDWGCRKQQPFGWGFHDSLCFFFRISHGEYANKKIRQLDENAYMKAYLFQRAPSLVFQYEDSE